MPRNLAADIFTQPNKNKKNVSSIGIVEYLERCGGTDTYFFDDSGDDRNEAAEKFGHAVRENLKDIKEVEVDISYKVVRLKLKRNDD